MSPHGTIVLDPAACTVCMICARECPDWCITIDGHVEAVGDPGARRPRTVPVLDRFSLDFGACMYCGICVQVCPFDALGWAAQATPVAVGRAAGVHDLGRHEPGTAAAGVSPDPAA